MRIIILFLLILAGNFFVGAFLYYSSKIDFEPQRGFCGTPTIERTYALAAVSTEVAVQYKKGRNLFNQCMACHSVGQNNIGPALKGITERYEREWLYKWIRNPGEFAKVNELAYQVSQQSELAMVPFPNFTDEDIEAILVYIEN